MGSEAPRNAAGKRGAEMLKAGETGTVELNLTPNALRVLEKRYLRKDDKGLIVESPDQMFRRVARNVAGAELLYDENADVDAVAENFCSVIANLEFLPNSPTLMNAGADLQQLSACFVLPVEDSMESIFDAVKYTALIHKSGGGTGFSFSRIRPKNDVVLSTHGISSGPISFMTVFDTATETIKQGGTRRGANMGILRVDHPDILDFITAKKDQDKLNNFNISVAVTDAFMEAVQNNGTYPLVNPRTGKTVHSLNAREVFNLMAEMAWKNGDPGVIFIDRINRDNPTPKLGAIESTNPCGEQPLLPFESCNLGSINLGKMVRMVDGEMEVDFPRLARTVHSGVRFLDNVIDVNHYPLEQIDRMTKGNRKIGLGVMGFADLLIQLGIPYNSERAVTVAGEIMSFINEESKKASAKLAEQRGAFPNYTGSIFDVPGGVRLRNATTTTVAPTGTLSILAGSSSGIEPLFAISYVRRVLDGDELLEVNPLFEARARREEFYSPELMRAIAEQGSLAGIDGVPDHIKELFVTALDIPYQYHIRMQAAFQEHTDNAVSKTINFPHNATVQDVIDAYELAYREGCKGLTIYRYGSREKQVLSVEGRERGRAAEQDVGREQLVSRERAKITRGSTEKVKTALGSLLVYIGEDEEGICEIVMNRGKSGGEVAAFVEALGRITSLALRAGISPESIIHQVKDIVSSVSFDDGTKIKSVPDAIAVALERYLERHHADAYKRLKEEVYGAKKITAFDQVCPLCGGPIMKSEGCMKCASCGVGQC